MQVGINKLTFSSFMIFFGITFSFYNLMAGMKTAEYALIIVERLRRNNIMYNEKFEEDILSIRDSVHGIVTGQNRDGNLYIDMQVEDEESDNGFISIPAFGYWSGHVNRGTEVLCTIKNWAKENRRIAVRIDSVDYDGEMAA